MRLATRQSERAADEAGALAQAQDDAHGSMWLLPALLLGMLLVLISASAQAALYKWTDERGIVHYSDKLPPDAVNRARSELSGQGLTVKRTERVQPITQRATKSEDEEQRQRQAERDKMIAARRDRALIESYANEGEIDLAKARAVTTIEGQVQSAEAFIAQMTRRREELVAKQVTYAPRPAPGSIAREIETIDDEVARQNEFVAAKKKESASVAARYDADKLRFRELRAGEPSGSIVTSDHGRMSTSQPVDLEFASSSPAKR